MKNTVDQMCIIKYLDHIRDPGTGRSDLIRDFQIFVFRSGPRFFIILYDRAEPLGPGPIGFDPGSHYVDISGALFSLLIQREYTQIY